MANPKRVIYPIFIECATRTTDPFWKEQFELLAYNKFPQELRYDPTHSNFILRVDKKSEVIGLPPGDDPTDPDRVSEIFKTTISILKTRLNMRSTRDLKTQKDRMSDTLQKDAQDIDCEWKKIKPKCVKEQLIMAYLSELSIKHQLTPLEYKQLVAAVYLGLQFKSISSDDIIYKSGKVLDIKHLSFDKTTRKFSTPEPKVCGSKTEKSIAKNKFDSGIDRFIKGNTARKAKLC